MGLSAGQQVNQVFLGGIPDQTSLVNNLNAITPLTNEQYNTNAATSAATATVPQMSGANDCVLNMTGTLGAGANLTTPTAAAILGALFGPNAPVVGSSWKVRIMNTSGGAFSWTLVGGTGVTVNGTATVAQNTWREFQVTVASATTLTMQNVGGAATV